VDVAYRLRLNRWQGEERLQLELVALRESCADAVRLQRQGRTYWVTRDGDGLVIRNAAGDELRSLALAGEGLSADHPQADHPYVKALIQDAAMALGLVA
jgi:single-stranded-DNA-specific exonuclease